MNILFKQEQSRLGAKGYLTTLLVLLLSTAVANADFIKDFSREAEILDAEISPKGDYIAVLKEIDSKRTLVTFKYPEMKLASVMSLPGRNEVGSFWWVNDERILASVALDFDRAEELEEHGELFAMNADGTKAKHLFGYRAGEAGSGRTRQAKMEYAAGVFVDPIWKDEKKVLINIIDYTWGKDRTVEAANLNVYTGKVSGRVRAPMPNAIMIPDRNGDVRFSYAQGAKGETVIHIRDDKTRTWKKFSNAAYGEDALSPLLMSEDGRIYVDRAMDGNPTGIYLMDPETGEFEEVYQHPVVDAVLGFDEFQNVVGIRIDDGKPERIPLDKKHEFNKLRKALQKIFPDANVGITSATADRRLQIAAVSQPTKTSEFYLYDRDAKKLELLFDERPWLDDALLGEMRPVSFKARDGQDLHGYLSIPAGHQDKNLPLVVVPHGGPHGVRDYWGMEFFASPLAATGYAALSVNFRGSGGYGSKFEKLGYGEWGKKMQNDVTDATQWAVDQGIADPERICLMGWSYGGYATLMGIIREQNLYKCAIAGAGVYDMDIMYRKTDFVKATRWGKKYLDKVIGPSAQDRKAASPVTYADKVNTPLMLIHGTEDARVPYDNVPALVSALKKAGKSKPTVVKLNRERHSPRNPKNVERLFRETKAFLEAHIGPGVKVPGGEATASAGGR